MRMTWKLWTTTKAKQSGARAKRLKPVHPGEILREEFLAPLALSANKPVRFRVMEPAALRQQPQIAPTAMRERREELHRAGAVP